MLGVSPVFGTSVALIVAESFIIFQIVLAVSILILFVCVNHADYPKFRQFNQLYDAVSEKNIEGNAMDDDLINVIERRVLTIEKKLFNFVHTNGY